MISREQNIIECEIYPKLNSKPTTKFTENKLSVSLPEKQNNLNDLFLNIDYIADTGMAFLNGTLVVDHFYFGEKWNIG